MTVEYVNLYILHLHVIRDSKERCLLSAELVRDGYVVVWLTFVHCCCLLFLRFLGHEKPTEGHGSVDWPWEDPTNPGNWKEEHVRFLALQQLCHGWASLSVCTGRQALIYAPGMMHAGSNCCPSWLGYCYLRCQQGFRR